MQDTKINKIREKRMQTQFYTGSANSIIFVKSFTTSEPHRDNPSLVFRNPYNSRDPQSLNQSH